MKNFCKIAVIIILIILLLGVFLRPETKKQNFNDKETTYIEIRHYNKTHKISNQELINELLTKLSDMKIKKFHPYISVFKNFQYGSSVDSYSLRMYESDNRNNQLCEVEFISDDLIKINGELFEVRRADSIYGLIKEITKYCIVPLPEMSLGNIYQYSTSGSKSPSKEAIYEMYCRILDCKPIPESQFKTSEDYISIETYDDEKINIYNVGNDVYIKYTKGNKSCCFVYSGIE